MTRTAEGFELRVSSEFLDSTENEESWSKSNLKCKNRENFFNEAKITKNNLLFEEKKKCTESGHYTYPGLKHLGKVLKSSLLCIYLIILNNLNSLGMGGTNVPPLSSK